MSTVYTFSPRPSSRKEGVSLGFFQVVALVVMGFLLVLLLYGGYLLFREYRQVSRLRTEVHLLEQETAGLKAQYARLTAKEVVLKRARALGLHPPRKEQIVIVK